MDTVVTVTVVSRSKDHAEKAINASFAEIEKIEKLTNFFSNDSEVAEINQNSGISEVKVSPCILDFLGRAVFVSEDLPLY